MTNEIAVYSDQAIMPQTFEGMMAQADVLAKSGLLPAEVKSAPAALAIMLTGRELGIPPMQAFRSIYIVKGKPTLSAQLMGALILRAGHAYRVIESTDARCVIEFRRRGQDHVYRHEFTIEDAKTAQLLGNTTWKAYPKAMLFSRCMSAGARVAMPDVLAGMYTPEELADPGQVVMDSDGEIVDVLPESQPTAQEQRDNARRATTRRNGDAYKPEPAPQPREHWIKDEAIRRRFWAWTTDMGLASDDVHEALGVQHIEEFGGGMIDAKGRIEAWVELQAATAEYAGEPDAEQLLM
jgi:hypothetical protein